MMKKDIQKLLIWTIISIVIITVFYQIPNLISVIRLTIISSLISGKISSLILPLAIIIAGIVLLFKKRINNNKATYLTLIVAVVVVLVTLPYVLRGSATNPSQDIIPLVGFGVLVIMIIYDIIIAD